MGYKGLHCRRLLFCPAQQWSTLSQNPIYQVATFFAAVKILTITSRYLMDGLNYKEKRLCWSQPFVSRYPLAIAIYPTTVRWMRVLHFLKLDTLWFTCYWTTFIRAISESSTSVPITTRHVYKSLFGYP